MKKIEIYVRGTYSYKFRCGTWEYYLSYKRAVIKRYGTVYDIQSQNRTVLYGLYMALQQVTEPCLIEIHTKEKLGFKTPKKSVNSDMLARIQNLINRAGHEIKIVENCDFAKVDMWEQVYGTPIEKYTYNKKENKSAKITNDTSFESIETDQNLIDFKHKIKGTQNAKPDISNASSPREVFKGSESHDWRSMYDDLDDGPAWQPGSGGY